MKNSKEKNKRNRMLVLLWHPKDMVAGGFIRIQKMLPFFSEFDITIIDNGPPLIKKGQNNVYIITYNSPRVIGRIYSINFYFGRTIEWLHATFQLVKIGYRELKKEKCQIIYGPTGDNLHIFLAGVILKTFFPRHKLLLDVLNLEMPEGSYRKYFETSRKNGISLPIALLQSYGMLVLLTIERLLIKKCDFVVTVSPYMKRQISKYYPKHNIAVTPSGVEIPKSLGGGDKVDVLYIGRHTKEKGIFDVLEAGLIVSRRTDIRVVTAGAGSYEINTLIEDRIKKNKIQNNFIMKGKISENEKWKLLSSAKVFLQLSYYEPLVPVITILEALASGLPVITYDVPAFSDVPHLKNHPSLIVVEQGNIKEVAQWIFHFLHLSKKDREKIAADARGIANQYKWRSIASIEVQAIKNLQ